MKVTALIPDALISEVRELAHEKNLTDSLIKALHEWSSIQKLHKLCEKVKKQPLDFRESFSAQSVRSLNR
jgi:hypothetical protein